MNVSRILAIAALGLLFGCTSHTEFGPCIGAFDDKNPKLEYKVSAWNLFIGILFIELIAPPIFVIVDETLCPIVTKASS